MGGMLLLASLDTFVGFVVFTMLPVMFVRLQVSGVVLPASGVLSGEITSALSDGFSGAV
jgi:hypothetical protein